MEWLAVLAAISVMMTSCSHDDGPEADSGESKYANITPLSQKFLTECNLSNWDMSLADLPGVDPDEVTGREVLDMMQDYIMVGISLLPRVITVGGTNMYFIAQGPTPTQVYLSAEGGPVKIAIIDLKVQGYDFIESINIEEITPAGSRAENDFDISMDEKGAYTLILPPNISDEFKVVNLEISNVGLTESWPDGPVYREGQWYQIVQFPWSDDESLISDPIITEWKRSQNQTD